MTDLQRPCAQCLRPVSLQRASHALLATLAILAASASVASAASAVNAYPVTGYPTTAYPATAVAAVPTVAPQPTYQELLPPVPTTPPVVEPAAALIEPLAAPVVTGSATGPVTESVAAEPAAPVEEAVHWYSPAYWWGPTPWDSGIEIGLNGASGTSDSVSFRTGGYVKRKADDYEFDGSLYYNKTQSEGVEIQSNALLDLRYDWLFDNSPWTLFLMSQSFYDEFQAFDFNFNANAGFGYKWVDEDHMTLTTSVGTGGSREFGGPDSEWVAEASFGLDYEMQLTDNRKFYAKADYFPVWDDWGTYRVLADIGMEFELHQPSNTSLKLSATDRYDSDPQGVEPHNLNYSVLLIWKK